VTSLFNLGLAALGMRDFEESMRYLDLATKVDPTDLDYLYEKAEVYLLAGRTAEGLEILEGIVAKDDTYHKAYMRLGAYYKDKGMEGRAAGYYEEALRAIKRRLEGFLERLHGPALKRREYNQIRKEVNNLKKDREVIEAELGALKGYSAKTGEEIQEARESRSQPPPQPAGALGNPTLGSPDAPVTIVEFLDLLCPFCARFAAETLPTLEERYVKTGKVRMVFRFFVIPGEPEELAAEAALCAAEQGAFMEFHDILLAKTRAGEPLRTAAALKVLAADLGLDTEAFARCLDSHRYAGMIERDVDEALSLGVKGTPTFFIEGRKLEGVVPFEELQRLIEEGLRG